MKNITSIWNWASSLTPPTLRVRKGCTFLLIALVATGSAFANNWGEKAAWSRLKMRPNNTGYYDLLDYDYPITAGSITYDKIGGGTIDPTVEYSNEVYMVVYINTAQVPAWNDGRGGNSLMDRYDALTTEFPSVNFLTVYSEGSSTSSANATNYFSTYTPPGERVVDTDGSVRDFCDLKRSTAYKSAALAIVNTNGIVSYREFNFGFFYNAYKLHLKRITDSAYDTDVRGLFPSIPRRLPTLTTGLTTLVYSDDFEGYTSGYDLKTATRWGFDYFTQYRVDAHAGLSTNVGVGGSTAAHLYCDYNRYKEGRQKALWRSNLEHDLTVPIQDGSFEFELKKLATKTTIPMDTYNGIANTHLIITFRQTNSIAPSGYLLIKNDTFLLIDENPFIRAASETGPVALSASSWHSIKIDMDGVSNAVVTVDGQSLGTLTAGDLVGMTFRCQPDSEFLIDDVIATYNGDPVTLQANHAAYVAAAQGAAVGEAAYTEPGSMTFDTVDKDFHLAMLEAPLEPNGDLELEQLYYPGEYVNIIADNPDKPVFLSTSRDRPVNTLFSRLFAEPAPQIYDFRKQLVDQYGSSMGLYDIPFLYLEYVISDYEELRELQHETIVAKEAARTQYGYVAYWEGGSEYETDHYLMRPLIDKRFNRWVRGEGNHPMGGTHGDTGSMETGVFILFDKNGKIVWRPEGVEHPYRDCFVLFDAVLNSNTIAATSSNLPNQVGSTYSDDFESYTNDTDVVRQKCWGLDYEHDFQTGTITRGRSQHLFGGVAEGEGRFGSQALTLDNLFYLVRSFEDKHYLGTTTRAYDNWRNQGGVKHMFPAPLSNGTFSVYLRQGPKTSDKRLGGQGDAYDVHEWFYMDILDGSGSRMESVLAKGTEFKESSLQLEDNTNGSVSIAEASWVSDQFGAQYPTNGTWHKVEVIADAGMIDVLVDSTNIGTFAAASFSGIAMHTRCLESMYLDDVELTYGIPEDIETDLSELTVPEGSTNVFRVRLINPPAAETTVTVIRASGDTNLSVQDGSVLTFTTSTWSNYQAVTISASQDSDWANGSAIFNCSSPTLTNDADVTATEVDDESDPTHILPWQETFENDGTNAGTLGDLHDQHGWVIDPTTGAAVESGIGRGSSQGCKISNADASHDFTDSQNEIWVQFYAKPVFAETNTVPADASAVFYINTNGNVVAYSNTVPVTHTGITCQTGTWHQFLIHVDYAEQTWDLSVDETNVLSDHALYSSQTEFTQFLLQENSSAGMYLDDISIMLSDPKGSEPDEDGDSIPDSWEITHYGSTNVNPSAMASNGVNTVLETYIAGLNPTNPKSAFLISDLTPLTSESILDWTGVSGRVYSVFWTSNLLSGFQPLESNIAWTAIPFTDTNHPGEEKGFYKIEVELE